MRQYGRTFHSGTTGDISTLDSIMSQTAREGVSSKYAFIPTTHVVNTLETLGWKPVRCTEERVHPESGRKGYQKHLIRFRQFNAPSVMERDQVYPEIILTNSHDGLASFQLDAGLYRVACANGLTVADSVFSTYRIKHMGYADRHVQEAVEAMMDTVPQIGESVKRFDEIELTPDEQGVYAMAAVEAKYGDSREVRIDRMLQPLRYADNVPTLWATFNRVQEKLIRGGKFAIKSEEIGGVKYKKTVKSRGVTALTEDIRINKALWILTEKMAELKAAK
jgi:hypothetical protein